MKYSRRSFLTTTALAGGAVGASILWRSNAANKIASDGYMRVADDPQDYSRLGIDRDTIAPWEDGIRMPTETDAYEWWYFDAHLDDGTLVVVVFYTKPFMSTDGTLAPFITMNITTSDGRSFAKTFEADPQDFSASSERCDVRIGENRFEGDLTRYHITAKIDDLSVDIDLVNEVPAWRPRSGHTYFGHEGEAEKLFAWLPSVPQGKVEITYEIEGESFTSSGTGYHDHNWGDVPMTDLMHNWYWARGKIGPYSVIASYITAKEEYSYQTQKVFMLAKDGVVIADDPTKVLFSASDVFTDDVTGKPVANITQYTYNDGDTDYVVTFRREQTILQNVFIDKLPFVKRTLAKLLGVDSAYLRFSGTATIEKHQNGELIESFEDPALWELMYFGHPKPLDV